MADQLTDAQLQDLVNDPRWKDPSIRAKVMPKLDQADVVRLSALEASANNKQPLLTNGGGQGVSLNNPPTDPKAAASSMMGSILHLPGTIESLATLPANFVPGPLRIPAAGILGGLGAEGDNLMNGEPFNIGNMVGGAVRSAIPMGIGRAISGPGANLAMKGAMQGASPDVVDAALAQSGVVRSGLSRELTGANLDKVGKAIEARLATLDQAGYTADRGELYKGAGTDLLPKLESQAGAPSDVRRAVVGQINHELNDPLNGPGLNGKGNAAAARLTPSEIAAQKVGARKGYEGIVRKQVQGQSVSEPSQVDFLRGKNAQTINEGFDKDFAAQPNSPIADEPALADINKQYGKLNSLDKYLFERKGETTSPLNRFIKGSLTGGLLEALYSGLQPDEGKEGGSYISRYGPAGMIGGLGYAMAPSQMAKLIQIAGKTLPPLVEGTTATISGLSAGVKRKEKK